MKTRFFYLVRKHIADIRPQASGLVELPLVRGLQVCAVSALSGTDNSSGFTNWRHSLRASRSLLDPRTCPSSLGIRSTPLLTRPLPIDSKSPHNLSSPNGNSFLSDRNRNQTHNSRSLSTHGLHIPPHLGSRRHQRSLEILMRFPRLPPLPENCFSLEVTYTAPVRQATTYM